jgi:hypothetical protein
MPEQQADPKEVQSAHQRGMADLDLIALVTWINAQHGTTFEVGERFRQAGRSTDSVAGRSGRRPERRAVWRGNDDARVVSLGWALDQQISGVVDWDGTCPGDRAFDLVTLLFYSYEQALVRDTLWQRVLALTDPAATAIYLAHMIHRQVDWSIRHHDRATIDRWLGQARAVLRDIPTRTGCPVPIWP